MLNKNQSHQRNSWKYTVVLPALIAFVFLFQIKVEAQEKEVRDVQKEIRESDAVSIALDSDDPDAGWYSMKDEFKDKGITTEISKLKRNKDNKIITINIVMKSEDGRTRKLTLDQNEPIKAIELYVSKMSNGKWDFGIRQIKSINMGGSYPENDLKDDNLNSSIEKSYDHWTINEVKNNGKNMLIVIDSKKQNNASPIEIPNNREIDNVVKIKEGDKLSKYGKDGENGVVIITTRANGETPKTFDFSNDQLIIINGTVYDDKTLMDLDPKFIEKMEVIVDKKSMKKYNETGKGSAIIVTTKKINGSESLTVKDKPIIFSNDNGDDIVITDNFRLFKVPGNPSVQFTDSSPILIVNGITQSNPKAILEIIDVDKIKSVRTYDENDKEAKGTQIKKVVITTN